MSSDHTDELKNRIKELEAEVAEREEDLAFFRKELGASNEKLEHLISDLSHELRLASRIQKTLVPTEYPNIPGFEFSTKFVASAVAGGDYFDIFGHKDKFRFGVMLASSSGHAMSALFLSILLKMSGRLEAKRGSKPQEILEGMANELMEEMSSKDSADLFYGVVDRKNYELDFGCIGEVYALHFSRGENELKNLHSSGKSLVQDGPMEVHCDKVNLDSRDRLILCSRGVVEAASAEGEQFGQERLFQSILSVPDQGVHEIRNQIFYDLEKFTQEEAPPRDQTVVVMEVKDKVIKLAK